MGLGLVLELQVRVHWIATAREIRIGNWSDVQSWWRYFPTPLCMVMRGLQVFGDISRGSRRGLFVDNRVWYFSSKNGGVEVVVDGVYSEKVLLARDVSIEV